MDMGSRRMQIVGIVLAVLIAALLSVTLWVYRPVSLAEAADAPAPDTGKGGGCGAPG